MPYTKRNKKLDIDKLFKKRKTKKIKINWPVVSYRLFKQTFKTRSVADNLFRFFFSFSFILIAQGLISFELNYFSLFVIVFSMYLVYQNIVTCWRLGNISIFISYGFLFTSLIVPDMISYAIMFGLIGFAGAFFVWGIELMEDKLNAK
ncbi:MAG: hypothetical protein WD512_05795 [Candidatus Paceibacterota bacterium]